jgi:hypothetical protein
VDILAARSLSSQLASLAVAVMMAFAAVLGVWLVLASFRQR